jgi:2'-5' RNA ligase
MRLFVGIALAEGVVLELESAAARLRSSGGPADRPARESQAGGWRWTAPESWHITLQFLGNATPEQLACLKSQLGELRSAPVPVEMGALGSFDRAGVFFADVQVTPGLAALAERVVAATSRCGFIAEARPFHPHITLARAKGRGRGAGLRTLAGGVRNQPPFSRFTALEFLLYESHLSAEGARYEVRGRFPLHEP